METEAKKKHTFKMPHGGRGRRRRRFLLPRTAAEQQRRQQGENDHFRLHMTDSFFLPPMYHSRGREARNMTKL